VLEQTLRGRDDGDGGDRDLISTSHADSLPDLFSHEIGELELELMAEVRTDPPPPPPPPSFGANSLSKSQAHSHSHSHAHEHHRKTLATARAAQLEAFMRAHSALFPMTPRPCGKLSAYFAWKKGRTKAAAGR
jgi:hypothetical protein